MSTGPCQAARAYQASKRWPPGPSQKTSCWEPSLATATAGVEVSVPSWGKPTGPFQTPVYQASVSWLVVVSFQKTICWEPSGVTATWGTPTLCGAKDATDEDELGAAAARSGTAATVLVAARIAAVPVNASQRVVVPRPRPDASGRLIPRLATLAGAPVDRTVPGAACVPALPEGGAGTLPEDDLGGAAVSYTHLTL